MKSKDPVIVYIRRWLLVFIIALVISGATAFFLETELNWIDGLLTGHPSGLQLWIHRVDEAIRTINLRYPYMSYGYDWLAFAHLVIAVVFYGAWKDPVRNQWIIQFGIIACCMIFPLALIAGSLRGIPFYWQLIDCSFGIIGLIPLTICYRAVKKWEQLHPAQP